MLVRSKKGESVEYVICTPSGPVWTLVEHTYTAQSNYARMIIVHFIWRSQKAYGLVMPTESFPPCLMRNIA